MARVIIASLLLLVVLASAAAVEARMSRAVFDDDTAAKKARELIGLDACQQTCDQVRFKRMCQSLTKLPGVTSPHELLLASLRVAAGKAKEAKQRVDAYAAQAHAGLPLSSMLNSCSEGYGSAADSLEETERRILAGDKTLNANRILSDALTSVGDCDNAFDERPEIHSPFADVQRNMFRVVDNALDIEATIRHSQAH